MLKRLIQSKILQMHSRPKLIQEDKNLKVIATKQFFGPRELEFAVKKKNIYIPLKSNQKSCKRIQT